MKKVFIVFLAFTVGLAFGFPVGTRVGVSEFMLADAQYKASILSAQIKAIKSGKVEPILTAMEVTLNGELAMHGEYMDSHLSWLWPELRSKDDGAIRRAVAYRLANPYQSPDLSKPESWKPGIDMESEFVQQVIEGQRKQQRYLRKVLERYADLNTNTGDKPSVH